MRHVYVKIVYATNVLSNSDQWIGFSPANKNRNRFKEPTFVPIGKRIVCEFQYLKIRKGIIFVWREIITNSSQIPEFFCLQLFILSISSSWLLYISVEENLTGKQNHISQSFEMSKPSQPAVV